MLSVHNDRTAMHFGSSRPGLFEFQCVDPAMNVSKMLHKLHSHSKDPVHKKQYQKSNDSMFHSVLHPSEMLSSLKHRSNSEGFRSRSKLQQHVDLNASNLTLRSVAQTRRSQASSALCGSFTSKKNVMYEGLSMSCLHLGSDQQTTPLRNPRIPHLSLESLDVDQEYHLGKILLSTPSSVEACINVCLLPKEFLRVSEADVILELEKEGISRDDTETRLLRMEYLERRRLRKYEVALRERCRILYSKVPGHDTKTNTCQVDESLHNSSQDAHSEDGNRVKNLPKAELVRIEEEKLQRVVKASQYRLQQRIAHLEQSRARRVEQEQERILQQEKEEAAREAVERRLAERERQAEEEQRKRLQLREQEREQLQREFEKRRALYLEKQALVQERIQERKARIRDMHQQIQKRNEKKRSKMCQQALENEKAKRALFEERWRNVEAAQKAFREKQEQERHQHQLAAKERQSEINAAIERAEKTHHRHVLRSLKKMDLVQVRLEQFEQQQQQLFEQRKKKEAEREEQRKRIAEESEMIEKDRIDRLNKKLSFVERHLREIEAQRAHDRRVAHELEKQKQMDKADAVEHMRRVEEHQRHELMHRITEKNYRVEVMNKQREELNRKRREHRSKIEAMKVTVENSTPGPGDYDVERSVHVVDPKHAQWKFGLSPDAHHARVILPSCPIPGSVVSPGPAAYLESNRALDMIRRKAPAFTISERTRAYSSIR